jgi:DNA invertase Pin-like site-specific DNA recombinase
LSAESVKKAGMNMDAKRAVIYARVSTDEQHTENQTLILTQEAERLGYEVFGTYAENASAWRGSKQVELKRLLHDAENHQFSALFVWALDRLTRKGTFDALLILNRLKNCGVKVISPQEPWLADDDDNPLREMLLTVCAWLARQESKRRSERTKAGLARAALEGKKAGRPAGRADTKKRKRPNMLKYKQPSPTDKRLKGNK